MYRGIVVLLLLVLPAACIGVESHGGAHGATIMALVGKWYVFWAVGVRLFGAGIRQVLQPRFTASEIFETDEPKAFGIVREVGFANLAMGTLGICSLYRPNWLVPAALTGGLYYGLAGLGHVVRKTRNANENVAMVSDGFAFVVLAVVVVNGVL